MSNTLDLNFHFQICPPVLHSLVSSLEGKPVILVLRSLLERDLRQEEFQLLSLVSTLAPDCPLRVSKHFFQGSPQALCDVTRSVKMGQECQWCLEEVLLSPLLSTLITIFLGNSFLLFLKHNLVWRFLNYLVSKSHSSASPSKWVHLPSVLIQNAHHILESSFQVYL